MSTTTRPELSQKNKYWIERHRYYELKHFCLQYPIWKKAYQSLDGWAKRQTDVERSGPSGGHSDPTEQNAEARVYYLDHMKMVEQAAISTDDFLYTYLLTAVTEGFSYEILKARLDIPCCKDTYYELYRRFFWLLSKARN